jgi:RIO kinase 1
VHSSRAEYFFLRDFDNIVGFLASFDPRLAVHRADGRAIWRAYVSRELTPNFVPPPPPPPRAARGFDPRARDNRPPQRFDGRPQQARDGRPQQARDGRPQQAQQPRPDNRPPQRDNRAPQRPNDRPGNSAPSRGRRRRPKRRW